MKAICRKSLALLLALVMCLSLAVVGASAYAEGDVAAIDDTGYTTLEAAIEAANAGDTVTLLTDVTVTQAVANARLPINKSMTIDGDNHTITINQRGFGVGMNAASPIDVTFKDVTIENNTKSGRCIDTRGNIGTLTLDNTTLSTAGASSKSYDQPLTIGGNQTTPAAVNIVNNSVIKTSEDGTMYYAITTFNPVNMTIDNSTIKGWACIYAKGPDGSAGSAGSVFNITDSTLVSKNISSGVTNSFSMFMAEDNNVTFNVTNSQIDVSATGDQDQSIVCTKSDETGVTASLGEGNTVTMTGKAVFEDNAGVLSVSGGSFNVPVPAANCAEGYKPTQNADGTYGVMTEGDAVAQIGTGSDAQYFGSLSAAIAAVPAGTETTITMIANETITVTGYAITVPTGKNVVLDLNGKTVSGNNDTTATSALIRNLGALTISDSAENGKLTYNPTNPWHYTEQDPGGYASNLIRNEGTLTVTSGILYNEGEGSATYAIDNYSTGVVTIDGGTIDAKKASAIRMFNCNGGAITVNDGMIGHYTDDDDCSYMGIQVMSGTNSDVEITGGTVNGEYSVYSNGTDDSSVSISGGTFTGYVGFGSAGPNSISITGGQFNEWVGTWGTQTGFISGGLFAEKPDNEYLASGFGTYQRTDDGLWALVRIDNPQTTKTGEKQELPTENIAVDNVVEAAVVANDAVQSMDDVANVVISTYVSVEQATASELEIVPDDVDAVYEVHPVVTVKMTIPDGDGTRTVEQIITPETLSQPVPVRIPVSNDFATKYSAAEVTHYLSNGGTENLGKIALKQDDSGTWYVEFKLSSFSPVSLRGTNSGTDGQLEFSLVPHLTDPDAMTADIADAEVGGTVDVDIIITNNGATALNVNAVNLALDLPNGLTFTAPTVSDPTTFKNRLDGDYIFEGNKIYYHTTEPYEDLDGNIVPSAGMIELDSGDSVRLGTATLQVADAAALAGYNYKYGDKLDINIYNPATADNFSPRYLITGMTVENVPTLQNGQVEIVTTYQIKFNNNGTVTEKTVGFNLDPVEVINDPAVTSPTRTGFTLLGWTVVDGKDIADDGCAATSGTVASLPKALDDTIYYAVWSFDGFVCFIDYAYAETTNKLMLVGLNEDPADGSALFFDGGALFTTTDSVYLDILNTAYAAANNNTSGTFAKVYVYIVDRGMTSALAYPKLKIDTGTNDDVDRDGDVNDNALINAGDFGIVDDLLAGRTSAADMQMRLEADVNTGDKDYNFGSIDDIVGIINKANGH